MGKTREEIAKVAFRAKEIAIAIYGISMEMKLHIPISFRFNQAKSIAILEYLLDQLNGSYNSMALLKLAYFADRKHLRDFARPISFDVYKAMKLGAVPQGLYNNIGSVNMEDPLWNNASFHNYTLTLKLKPTSGDELSESERSAIIWSLENFERISKKDPFDLANLTHAYPEWDKFKDFFDKSPGSATEMFYEDFVKTANPEHNEFKKNSIADPFPSLSDQDQTDILEEMWELSQNM